MNTNQIILVSGAAGFIASVLCKKLNEQGFEHLILVDDFLVDSKRANFQDLKYAKRIQRTDIDLYFDTHPRIDLVIHLGARTDTTEMDASIHTELNLEYSKKMWTYCTKHQVPFIYASSAATYGDGALGYEDRHELIPSLQPLNPYGVSKNEFDKWALQQNETPPHWYGLKFFNVYGPHEEHKGRMASVIYHAYHQIKKSGELKLFRSHNPNYVDGGQMRDFIYVNDVVNVIRWLSECTAPNGIYNLGTGKAETFLTLGYAVFQAMQLPVNISFIDTPLDIRDKYQYYTQADMTKLRNAGYTSPFTSLTEGAMDYVKEYLMKE